MIETYVGDPVATEPLTGRAIRKIVLEQSYRAGVGHIGSALSIADILAACYGGGLDILAPGDPRRDCFVLSKGHAALALYAALYLRGWLDADDLSSYCANGSRFGVHPEHTATGIEFSTGSLGQGLSLAVGNALAARLVGHDRRVAVVMSDAECNEGSVWEAAAFAAQHRLNRIRLLIDCNGQQALGYTRDILEPTSLESRFRAFGWDVHVADGHDMKGLVALLRRPAILPLAIVARTTFGRGVSFMENQVPWHYLPMNSDQYRAAMEELG